VVTNEFGAVACVCMGFDRVYFVFSLGLFS
jgi:hypothetical protein